MAPRQVPVACRRCRSGRDDGNIYQAQCLWGQRNQLGSLVARAVMAVWHAFPTTATLLSCSKGGHHTTMISCPGRSTGTGGLVTYEWHGGSSNKTLANLQLHVGYTSGSLATATRHWQVSKSRHSPDRTRRDTGKSLVTTLAGRTRALDAPATISTLLRSMGRARQETMWPSSQSARTRRAGRGRGRIRLCDG